MLARLGGYLYGSALFLGSFLLYLATRSQHYSPDSMAFALLSTQGDLRQPLFSQAEHLLYPWVGWVWYRGWVFLGYGEGALLPLQVLSALAGAAGVLLCYQATRRYFHPRTSAPFLGVLAGLALAVSYAYWYHATEAEDQILSNALLLGSFLILLHSKQVRHSEGLLALLWSLAILLHATQVLFLPAVLVGLWLARKRWWEMARLLGLVALFVGIPYLLVGSLWQGRSLEGLQAWFTAAPGLGVWGELGLGNLWMGAKTLAKSFVFLGEGPNLRALLGGNFEVENLLSVLGFAFVGSGILLGFLRTFEHQKESGVELAIPLAWAVPYTLFNLYWAPEDIQFWIAIIPPIILVLLASFDGALFRGWAILSISILSALFLANLVLFFAPRSRLENNEDYAKALCLREHTRPQDLIITPGWDWVGSYVPYFAKRQVLSILDTYLLSASRDRARLLSLMEDRVRETQEGGGRVYVARLFSLRAQDAAWFRRVTGLRPEDFPLRRSVAWECLGELLWDVEWTKEALVSEGPAREQG